MLHYCLQTRLSLVINTQAIERGSMKKLEDTLRLMKQANALLGHYLDVCYLLTTVSQYSEKVVVYYMTLLAHAAVHQRTKMAELLIRKGASKSNRWAYME